MTTSASYLYLGTAVTYPITLAQGSLAVSSGLSVIENSIVKIITTKKGTRFMLPEYGCNVSELLFDPNDEIAVEALRIEMLDALVTWEKRAEFFDIIPIVITDGVICIIQYRILQSSQFESFIFPLYKSLIY